MLQMSTKSQKRNSRVNIKTSSRKQKRRSKNASKAPRKYRDMQERLIANSIVVGSCWIWIGRFDRNGRPRLNVRENGKHKTKCAYRVAYEVFKGNLSTFLTVHHTCYDKRCINPVHLTQVSRSVNSSLGNSGYDLDIEDDPFELKDEYE